MNVQKSNKFSSKNKTIYTSMKYRDGSFAGKEINTKDLKTILSKRYGCDRKTKGDYSLTKKLFDLIYDVCLCSREELCSSNRDQGLTVARAIFATIERRLNKRHYTEIADLIEKDHTSVMHMTRRMPTEYRYSKIFQVYMRNDELKDLFQRAMKEPNYVRSESNGEVIRSSVNEHNTR